MSKLIKCAECDKEISKKAKTCPHCGAPNKKRTSLFTWLVAVIAILVLIPAIVGVNSSTSYTPSDKSAASINETLLEVQSWDWRQEHGYAILEGEVKNISSKKINNVAAVGAFRDSNGNLIRSDSAIIDYNPIMPGQTSPFKVIARWNPQMKNAALTFKYLLGGQISAKEK